MAARTFQVKRESFGDWRIAAAGLVLAGAVVGVAIVIGGAAARTLNGVGALLWLISAGLLAFTLPLAQRRMAGWLAAIVAGLLLGGVIRPGTLAEAVIWFAVAGAAVALIASDRLGAWALLVPAIYLPVHLLIGIGRAIMRGGAVRTEPPPTPAILPLVMILAAAIGGALAAAYFRRSG
jgi:hypothetical protein